MLLMNRSGRVYDFPEHLAREFVALDLSSSKETINEMLSTLRTTYSPMPEEDDCGCCCIYSNYCPNK